MTSRSVFEPTEYGSDGRMVVHFGPRQALLAVRCSVRHDSNRTCEKCLIAAPVPAPSRDVPKAGSDFKSNFNFYRDAPVDVLVLIGEFNKGQYDRERAEHLAERLFHEICDSDGLPGPGVAAHTDQPDCHMLASRYTGYWSCAVGWELSRRVEDLLCGYNCIGDRVDLHLDPSELEDLIDHKAAAAIAEEIARPWRDQARRGVLAGLDFVVQFMAYWGDNEADDDDMWSLEMPRYWEAVKVEQRGEARKLVVLMSLRKERRLAWAFAGEHGLEEAEWIAECEPMDFEGDDDGMAR